VNGPLIAGWQCQVCGAQTDIAEPFTWRCPNAAGGDHHHAPALIQSIAPLRAAGDANPFIAYRRYLAVDSFAAANGMTDVARAALIATTDSAIRDVAGVGFHETPFERSDELSTALGFGVDGGIWVKDEMGQVAGSHKARHLMTILLHLLAAESLGVAPWADVTDRPPLAIASCGNAAVAAATLAAAARWPITVFVPTSVQAAFATALRALAAAVVECPRRASDPPGDPCVHRFREAVAAGAVPFTVQGPENAWCLDGGRTVGWEMVRRMEETIEGPPFDRVFLQVGSGAFAASVMAGFRMGGLTPKLHAVQTEACAPLARAWAQVRQAGGMATAASRWAECMWPWEHVGSTAADGIVDDETYDWLAVTKALHDSGGSAVVATEAHVGEANELGCRATGVDASHTGTAGLAGVLSLRGELRGDERIAVVFSGMRR
jgi:threonine synthase